jgi:RND superfamily putative drug exporter
VLALVAPAPDPTVGENADLLPADTPVHRGLDQLAEHFGDKSGLSTIVIVFERTDGPLTPGDLAEVERIGAMVLRALPGESISNELSAISVRTPGALAVAGKANPLISEDGRAALVWVSLPFNYITKQAARVVKHTQEIVAGGNFPAGLLAAVTGSAGYGYDYGVATERSHQKTLIVTLISVIVILLIVYRAPIAALMPLAAISIAAGVVFKMLAFGERFGVHSGTAEQIFTFVLLYGAGVDYSLLLMSRFKEFLDEGRSAADAVALALDASAGAIISSAAMTVSGLIMFCFARFSVFRDAGPAVVLALVMAAVASVTLVPAMLAIIGPVVFWPANRRDSQAAAQVPRRRFWTAVARFVVPRPGWVMCLTLAALLLPAVRGVHLDWNYDALYSLKSTYQAPIGTAMVERHWPTGEIAPIDVLVVTDRSCPIETWKSACDKITAAILGVADVDNVRALTMPLGVHAPAWENAAMLLLANDQINSEFISADQRAMRMSAILKVSPLGREAMDDATSVAGAADRAAAQAGLNARIHITGATAEMIDTRTVTQQDFRRVSILALGAMLLVVTTLLRDIFLAIFILAATALSYFTTLGLTFWIFRSLGATGLEWKVQMMLFIVLMAVGQDYSIFFAMRLAQERKQLSCAAAVERALIFTGPVISTCGLIMAATLGSVMAGDVRLLVQMGLAFVLGMLIDTFIVRPLLLPSFISLRERLLRQPVKAVEMVTGK